MKLVKMIASLCVAITLALAVAACAPTRTSEGTGGYIDDTVITAKVKSALLAEQSLKSTEIGVETFKGQVQLSGFVSSSAMAKRAVEITRGIAGVQSVSDVMQVR